MGLGLDCGDGLDRGVGVNCRLGLASSFGLSRVTFFCGFDAATLATGEVCESWGTFLETISAQDILELGAAMIASETVLRYTWLWQGCCVGWEDVLIVYVVCGFGECCGGS